MRRAVNRPALRVERLEDRVTPFNEFFAAGAGPGGPPLVNVYSVDANDAVHKVAAFVAYEPGFKGGVTVAVGDVTGDGVDDVVTGPGPGRAPTVNLIDGASLLKGQVVLLRSFNAYDPAFTGGVYVASSFGGSAPGFIATGAGAGGGPHVRVFDYRTLAVTRQFYAYDPKFRGGVRVAVGPDHFSGEITTGAGPGGGPHVKVYNPDGSLLTQFYAFAPSFTGGVFVATSEGINVGDSPNFANLIVTAGPGGPPDVRLYLLNAGSRVAVFLATVTPYPNFHGGVSATSAFDPNDVVLLVTAPGPGGGPDVRLFRDITLDPVSRFNAFDPAFLGGVNVAGSV